MENGLPKLGYLPMTFKYNWGFFLDIVFRDWSKSIGVGGGGGGWVGGLEHLEMWLIKNTWPSPSLRPKMTDPPLKQGVGSCMTHPLVKTWMFGFLLIIQ